MECTLDMNARERLELPIGMIERYISTHYHTIPYPKAAFDTVDHNILLNALLKQYGVSKTILDWYDSHLRPRSFKVNVGSAYSTSQPLDFSVHQGSFAGPTLVMASQ